MGQSGTLFLSPPQIFAVGENLGGGKSVFSTLPQAQKLVPFDCAQGKL